MFRNRRHVAIGLSGACLGLLLACTADVPDEGQSTADLRSNEFRGAGDTGRLKAEELKTYVADEQYVQGLTKPDVRIRLNLADPRQHRFAMSRLKIAGKTPANSPHLFELVEQRRQAHLAQGYKPGLLPESGMATLSTAERQEMHYIETASLGETTPVLNDGVGTANSTYPDGSLYVYTDVNFTDVSGFPLGTLRYVEQYNAGQKVTINTTGNLGRTRLKRYRISTYKAEDTTAGFQDSYLYTEVGSSNTFGTAAAPTLAPAILEAPLDLVLNDNLISVCLNRTWTQDCDYDLTSTPQAIKLPLKGSIRILSAAHVFNKGKIQEYIGKLRDGIAVPEAGSIKLVLTNSGGGCDVMDGNTLNADMLKFWESVAAGMEGMENPTLFSWDLTGANSAFFDDGCRQVQDSVKLTAFIPLPMKDAAGPTTYRSSITISNDPATDRKDLPVKDIEVTNSCLAAGTEIELATGEAAPIESLKAGALVSNPYRQQLTVMDTAIGFEPVPMVRIKDDAGRSLLMTEMHPIQVAGRGMVQARALRSGDPVMTRTGPSKLVSVTREAFGGKVYNVKVGSSAEKTRLGVDQTVVYANGFVVGDGQIQKKYEEAALARKPGPVPSQWRRDYLLANRK